MKIQDITHIFMHLWLWFSVKFEDFRGSAQEVKFYFKNEGYIQFLLPLSYKACFKMIHTF